MTTAYEITYLDFDSMQLLLNTHAKYSLRQALEYINSNRWEARKVELFRKLMTVSTGEYDDNNA